MDSGLAPQEMDILSGDATPKDGFQSLPTDIQVEEHLQLHHLEKIMKAFNEHNPPPTSGSQGQPEGLLTLIEFKDTVAKVLGTRAFDDQLENLFTKLDMSGDGYVDWNAFCTYLLLQLREKDFVQTKRHARFDPDHKLKHIVYNRQETTSRILSLDGPLRFITISKEGVICVWDQHMHIEKHFQMVFAEETARSPKQRVKMWVNDAVYMPNCRKIAVASTGRDIKFYDVTSSQYNEEYQLYGLPDVPTCLDYYYNEKDPSAESLLVFGDDQGAVHILTFLKPLTDMFESRDHKAKGVTVKVFFPELEYHSRVVRLSSMEAVHPEEVRRVQYMAENQCIISSCLNPRNSLVIRDASRKRSAYIFNLSKGIECFDYSKRLNTLVTGSVDHLVRIWNPYVPSKAVATLEGHALGIVDVKIHTDRALAISMGKDNVLKVWDLREHSCTQTIVLKFPSTLTGRMPEHGYFGLHLHCGSITRMLAASNDYIAVLRLASDSQQPSMEPTTHLTQLCTAIYNPHFKQVVTSADDSTIALWDIETGRKSMMFTDAHGKEEITCLTLDESWRRLISGARNGTIKVWNVQNGHCQRHLEAVADAEVTGIIPLADRKIIVSVGWSRKITVYDDSHPENTYIRGESRWRGGHEHQDDILAAAYLPPGLLATASFDGEICVWALETRILYTRLRRAVPNTSTMRKPTTPNSRPNSRHRQSHRPPDGQSVDEPDETDLEEDDDDQYELQDEDEDEDEDEDQPEHPGPVDKLLFLTTRAQAKHVEQAILISSEAGILRFWTIYGQKRDVGYFYAPERRDESVLGLTTDPNNDVIITGDTTGRIAIWDVADYCLQPQEKIGERPVCRASWSGHDSAVVSVEHVIHDTGIYVVSASTDKTAKLWTVTGHCVGMFGQKNVWNIRQPETWEQPPPLPVRTAPPALVTDESQTSPDPEISESIDVDEGREEAGLDQSEERKQSVAHDVMSQVSQSPASRRDVASRQGPAKSLSRQSIYTPLGPIKEDPKRMSISSNRELPPTSRSESSMTTMNGRSLRCASGSDRLLSNRNSTDESLLFPFTRSKTMLGERIEEELDRRQRTRQGRRGQYGEVQLSQTSRLGQQCCPFQALTTLQLDSVGLPGNLPMSSRMTSRGYTPQMMTADALVKLDLSFFPAEADTRKTSRDVPGKERTERASDRLPHITRSKSYANPFSSAGEAARFKRGLSSAATTAMP